MQQTFKEFILESGASQDVILEAMKNYLSRQGDFRNPQDLVDECRNKTTGEFIDSELDELRDSAKLMDTALEILSYAWLDESEQPKVAEAFAAAKKKLPVLELSVLQLFAMYGLFYMGWLVVTKGKKEETVVTYKDGHISEKRTTKFASSPLLDIVKLNPLGHIKNED